MLMQGYSVTIFILFSITYGHCSTHSVRRHFRQAQSPNLDPVFYCGDRSRSTVFTRLNDGVNDCGDNSDENNDPLLFYSVLHPDQQWDPVFRGFFLRSDRTFRTTTVDNCQDPWTLLAARGPYVYLTCPEQHNEIIQMTRNGSHVVNISRSGKKVQTLLFDEITGNAYLLENSRIKLCNENFNFCSILHGRWRHKPISLAFSNDRGFLFWIERKEGTESYLVRAQRDGENPEIILRNNTDPFEFVTIDQSSNKLYWLTNIMKSIYSSSLDGSDVTLIQKGLNHIRTFVVDRGRLYWADQTARNAFTCDTGAYTPPQCKPDRYQPGLSQNQIGQNIIIYTRTNRNMREVCALSSCSHLCTYVSESDHTCFCDASTKKMIPNIKNGFCEEITVTAAQGKDIYIIGLKDSSADHSYSPIIRKITFKNISSISTIAYDSIQGRVIVTETQNENIYEWKPGRSDELELITHQEGMGTINSLEFDDAGNNIYWISPSKNALQVTSCLTNKTITLFTSDLSLSLFDFTLAPNKGYMFVLFKTNTSIHLERISMNGDMNTRRVMHHFKHTDKTKLSLHYMRSRGFLLLMDRLNNNILFSELKSSETHAKFDFFDDGYMSILESITSLDNSVIWVEANGLFQVKNMQMHEQAGHISFYLKNETAVASIRIAGVVAPQESTNKCGLENGNCRDVCLVSNVTSYVCRCSSNNSTTSCELIQKGNRPQQVVDEGKSERYTHRKLSSGSSKYFVGFLEFVIVASCIIGTILAYYKCCPKKLTKYNVFLGNRTISHMNMTTVTGTNEN